MRQRFPLRSISKRCICPKKKFLAIQCQSSFIRGTSTSLPSIFDDFPMAKKVSHLLTIWVIFKMRGWYLLTSSSKQHDRGSKNSYLTQGMRQYGKWGCLWNIGSVEANQSCWIQRDDSGTFKTVSHKHVVRGMELTKGCPLAQA